MRRDAWVPQPATPSTRCPEAGIASIETNQACQMGVHGVRASVTVESCPAQHWPRSRVCARGFGAKKGPPRASAMVLLREKAKSALAHPGLLHS